MRPWGRPRLQESVVPRAAVASSTAAAGPSRTVSGDAFVDIDTVLEL